MSRPTFEQAKSLYPHRFTMEHVPTWAKRPLPSGRYYAPQFRTDAEWYANTTFPGESGHTGGLRYCTTKGATWPLGEWLNRAYERGPVPTYAEQAATLCQHPGHVYGPRDCPGCNSKEPK
jgi:hypothetical protein